MLAWRVGELGGTGIVLLTHVAGGAVPSDRGVRGAGIAGEGEVEGRARADSALGPASAVVAADDLRSRRRRGGR
jgi:hypothetical protein